MSSKNVDDRLSMLPEEILSHILSLMPTKFAVRTSILSKRWRYTWMFVTNLDFDYIPITFGVTSGVSTFLEFVDRVMELCKTSQLQSFRLHLPPWSVQYSRASNWIDKAIRLNVRELDVCVMNRCHLPLSLFTCKTLTSLRLDSHVWNCPSRVNLPCLKTLDIIVYNYTYPIVNALKLIHGCPVLESLYFDVWHDGVVDYIFNIPTLKWLELTLRCSSVLNKVDLNVPNLEYVFVGGTMCFVFVTRNVSSLVEASVSVDKSESSFDHMWFSLLNGVSGVKSLSIKTMPSTLNLPIFPNMEHLELKSVWCSSLILEFLKNSPALKHLYIDKLAGSFWIKNETKMVPACMLTNLTTIKFSNSIWCKPDMRFLKYMLGNAEVLKTVTITWEGSTVEERAELRVKLRKFPRASRYCKIHFLK